MRVGVAGCGYWGAKHVRVLQGLPQVSSVLVIDPRRERREEIVQAVPGVSVAANVDQALDDLDALVVATPPSTHASISRRALRAGKHVLVEKPFATTLREAEAMVRDAADAGVVLMAGHTFEYNAAVWRLRDLVQSGELGDLYYLDTARLNLGLYQPDINVVWDLAPHDVSIANYVLQDVPTSVEAWGASHAHVTLQDVAYLRLEYERLDLTAHVHVSWLDPCKVRRVTLVGSRKMAVYNDLNSEERLRIYDKGVAGGRPQPDTPEAMPMSYRYGNIVSPFIAFDEPLRVEDQHFIDCILSGETPASDGRAGAAVVAVLEAAQASLERRGPVPVEIGMELRR